MQMENNAQELTGIKKYFKEQNIELSFNRIAIQGLGGMAHGLFASLLIGTIIKTIGGFIPGSVLSLIHISEPTRQAEKSYAVFFLKKKKKKEKE